MELQLVYRILRKISDWSVTGYYSEIFVEGTENILNIQPDVFDGVEGSEKNSVNGPIILCSTHHNEMIDIATLAMTMPKCQDERRHVSFWAKESMFENALGGWIMRSSGAIAVKRNPNKTELAEKKPEKEDNSLFASTTRALTLNKVVGVFPEGTSYTQPRIVQVMPGAARAAVEYEVSRRHNGGQDIVIVPVGIVYTDKSRYQSRIVVRYGAPIRVKEYFDELSTSFPNSLSSSVSSFSTNPSMNSSLPSQHVLDSTYSLLEAEDASAIPVRAITKALTLGIENALFDLTINAPDWETLYAAGVARDIIFQDKEIPLSNWVSITHSYIDLLSSSSSTSTETLEERKRALNRYFALLHHTGLTHAVLQDLFPVPLMLGNSPNSTTLKDVRHWSNRDWSRYHAQTLSVHLRSLFSSSTALKDVTQIVAILPVLPFYLPAFLISHLTAQFLATPGEEEGEAQFRSVGGGVGLGIGFAIGKSAFSWIWRRGRVEILESILTKVGAIADNLRLLLAHLAGSLGTRLFPSLQSNTETTIGLSNGVREQSIFNLCPSIITDFISNAFRSPIMRIWMSKMMKGAGWLIAAWCVVKWYGLCIKRAHRTYTRTLTPPVRKLWIHHLSVLTCRPLRDIGSNSHILHDPDLIPYLSLPQPPTNAFIRKREQAQAQPDNLSRTRLNAEVRPMPSTSKLLTALLVAREDARRAASVLVEAVKPLS